MIVFIKLFFFSFFSFFSSFLYPTHTRKMSLAALEEIQTVMMLLTDVLGKDIAKLVWQYYARLITREQKLAILLESEKKNKSRYQDLKEFQYNFRCDMSGHTAYARFFFVQNIDRTLIYQRYRHIDRVRRVNGLDSRYGNSTNKKPPSRAGICTGVMERWICQRLYVDEANVLSDCRTGRKRSRHGTTQRA